MAAAKKSAGKSMDVMKPGDSTPENSGRPILVTNRPIMQDPMVKDTSEEAAPEEKEQKSASLTGGSKVIAPLGDSKTEDDTPDDPTPDTPAEEAPTEANSSIPTAEEEKAQAAVVDAVVANSNSNQSPQQQEEIAQDERRERVQKLVESKKYLVPIGQVSRKKLHHQLLLVCFLILVVGGVYVAADMGYVPLPFELPVHVVKR